MVLGLELSVILVVLGLGLAVVSALSVGRVEQVLRVDHPQDVIVWIVFWKNHNQQLGERPMVLFFCSKYIFFYTALFCSDGDRGSHLSSKQHQV